MARWKLACPHYINVPDVEWEYNENKNGKINRKRFPVPRYLNTADPGDWTVKWGGKDDEDGEIIVCLKDKGERGDITFLGDPTPDMIPVDDEARAISKTFEHRWSYRPETAETDFSQSLVDKFEIAMGEIAGKPAEVPGMTDLIGALTSLTQLMAAQQLAQQPVKPSIHLKG
jgi:hypothetical protein